MNSEYNDIENIERYLEGNMSVEERAAFEKASGLGDHGRYTINRVSTDDYQAAVNAIKIYNHNLLKSRLRDIHKDIAMQRAAVRKVNRWYWAAAVLVVGLATVLFVQNWQTIKSEEKIVKEEQLLVPEVDDIAIDSIDSAAEGRGREQEEEESRQLAVGSRHEDGEKEKKGKEKMMADAYVKNPKYETLIATIYRAADIRISSPDTTATFTTSDTIVFRWEGSVDEELILKIIDNKEKLMFEVRLHEVNKYEFSNMLSPALYYWVLETEDDNMGYGRFLIR